MLGGLFHGHVVLVFDRVLHFVHERIDCGFLRTLSEHWDMSHNKPEYGHDSSRDRTAAFGAGHAIAIVFHEDSSEVVTLHYEAPLTRRQDASLQMCAE
jgi:hypothetical protein